MVFNGSTAADTTPALSVLGQRSVGNVSRCTVSRVGSPAAGQRVSSASVSVQIESAPTRPCLAAMRERCRPSASNSKMRMPTSVARPSMPATLTE